MLLSTKAVVAVLLGLSGISNLYVLAQTNYPTVANTFGACLSSACNESNEIAEQRVSHQMLLDHVVGFG